MRLKAILGALAVAAVGVPSASAVVVTGDENAQTTYLQDKTVITVTHPVTVGLGGVMNTNAKTESMGGYSTILGLMAWGGGFGAKGQGFTPSSGGGSVGWPDTTKKPGSAAAHTGAPDFNLANAGGDCSGPYTPGGRRRGG